MGRYSPMLAMLALLSGASAAAQDGPETALVAGVIDGDTAVLADGRELRLAGILVPKREEPLADAARLALAAVALDKAVLLTYGDRRMDRHGRVLAQAWLAAADGSEGDWLQGRLLADGLARVATMADSRGFAAEMLQIEAAARAARRGIWSDPAYAIREIGDGRLVFEQFQIVEGRPATAEVRRNRGYLNFGEDYRTDFTLSISPDALRQMEASGRAVESFKEVRLRARGWLRWFNGPMIDITHPEQIEVLE